METIISNGLQGGNIVFIRYDSILKIAVEDNFEDLPEHFEHLQEYLGLYVEEEPFKVLRIKEDALEVLVVPRKGEPRAVDIPKEFWEFFEVRRNTPPSTS